MSDLDSTRQKEEGGAAAQVLIWGGVFLLLAGGLLIYPYISSRLVIIPPTSTPVPSPTNLVTFPPLLAVTDTPAPKTPSPTSSPASTHTPTYEPASPPPPTATAVPALPSRIVIPSINVDAPILPVSLETIEIDGQQQAAWQVLDMYAAGWHETSATLGIPGNTVLNGHNTTHGEVFRDLYTLKPGDLIVAYSDDTPFTYTVTEILILPETGQSLEVRIDNARHILPTNDERLTLVTCHPYGSLRNRLIVIAHPSVVPEDIEA
jgi:sortase A